MKAWAYGKMARHIAASLNITILGDVIGIIKASRGARKGEKIEKSQSKERRKEKRKTGGNFFDHFSASFKVATPIQPRYFISIVCTNLGRYVCNVSLTSDRGY